MDMITGMVEETISVKKKKSKNLKGFREKPV